MNCFSSILLKSPFLKSTIQIKPLNVLKDECIKIDDWGITSPFLIFLSEVRVNPKTCINEKCKSEDYSDFNININKPNQLPKFWKIGDRELCNLQNTQRHYDRSRRNKTTDKTKRYDKHVWTWKSLRLSLL